MTTFDQATRATRADATTYDVRLDDGYAAAGRLNGGYLLAVLARAAVDASPFEHPISTAAQFLRSPAPGPATVRVEPLRAGRSTAMVRATLVQDGAAHVEALITNATLTTGAEPDWSAEPPRMPPPAECAALPAPKPESGMTLSARLDLLFDPDTIGWRHGAASGRPETRAWFRMVEPVEPDPYVLALAVDSMPPVVYSAGFRGWAPTVELTWHLRALPAPGPLLLAATGRLVSDGRFDEDVEVWDAKGRLVAQSRQLALLGRVAPPERSRRP
ncbi:thioesterase family protein [Spongiactinospora sp. TRM90649]|uniref:thioesterase family protein n=1 Tax=Spongiactinospora sp. TRM90649 TaxID=3031114 RepID=UPI0023F8A016|nr:thioesterase family protein [Spongiactinospora sp. TRM90649]MDF5752605.1 thioesterase family protein [Spongiactinospora sp. TRM90649]